MARRILYERGIMKNVEYFHAAKQTHRFNENQKVWVSLNCANHMYIYFKWRGKGRYVSGVIDRFDKSIGEIKSIDVDDAFAERIEGSV
jgi:hypothetical protein